MSQVILKITDRHLEHGLEDLWPGEETNEEAVAWESEDGDERRERKKRLRGKFDQIWWLEAWFYLWTQRIKMNFWFCVQH